MPTVAYVDEEETRQYASLLFSELTRERLINNGVPQSDIQENPELEFLNVQLNRTCMRQIGRDLRVISEQFAQSSERNRVLEKAQQVDIGQVDFEEFKQFLNELFSNGITRERIVVLFFFCSDVVVRAYSNPLGNIKRLFQWFLSYITDRICGWVASHGGWQVVLGTYVPAFSQTVFYCLGSAAIVMFMYKKIFNY